MDFSHSVMVQRAYRCDNIIVKRRKLFQLPIIINPKTNNNSNEVKRGFHIERRMAKPK